MLAFPPSKREEKQVRTHALRQLAVALILFSSLEALAGTRTITPTTTLTAETANNTSAAPTLAAQPNGNAAPGNVSKQPVLGLLYSGANAPIYAHFMGWFGGTNHMNVGYQSD